MSVEITWKQNILVTDFHLLKSLLVVLGFGSQASVCGFSRQNINSVFQKTILSLKSKFPTNNSKVFLSGNLNFKFRVVFWNIFSWRFGDLKNESNFLKKATFRYWCNSTRLVWRHFVQCVFPSALCVLRRPLNSSQLQQHTSPTIVNISSGQQNLVKRFL